MMLAPTAQRWPRIARQMGMPRKEVLVQVPAKRYRPRFSLGVRSSALQSQLVPNSENQRNAAMPKLHGTSTLAADGSSPVAEATTKQGMATSMIRREMCLMVWPSR